MTPKEQKQSDETNIAVMANNVTAIKDDVKDIKTKLENNYVTKEAFEPIRNGFYGLVSIVTIAVLYAILAVVLKK